MNRHEPTHHVSSSPSKIPYGGFSPVRLQIDIPPRSSLGRTHATDLYAGHRPLPPLPRVALRRAITATRAALGSRSRGHCRSRGPWLASGLCCPTGSSLNMASSEPLHPTRGLIVLRPSGTWDAEGPNFYLPVLPSVPSALPRRTRWSLAVGPPPVLAFAMIRLARHPYPGKSAHTRSCNEAAQFALCCGPEGCSPFTDKGFYFRAFIP